MKKIVSQEKAEQLTFSTTKTYRIGDKSGTIRYFFGGGSQLIKTTKDIQNVQN